MTWKLRGPLGLPLLLVLATGISGCSRGLPTCRVVEKASAEYFRVDYRVRAENGIVPRAEVRAAGRFEALRNTWTEGTAAIRLPDKCRQESAGSGTGAMGQGGGAEIMATTCGFWLAELERALVKAKYKVVSWNALNQVERTRNVPTYVAARDLGADLVFLINSLEDAPSALGSAYSESFRFFDSNEDGAKKAPRELDDDERAKLKGFVRDRTNVLRNGKNIIGIKAILDMTAVDTKTGEAVWFYLKQEAKPVPSALDRRFLFAKYHDSPQWWPVLPTSLQSETGNAVGKEGGHHASSDEESGESMPAPEDAYKAERNELVRSVVDDFMNRFRGQGS